jgi:hypothetical protein
MLKQNNILNRLIILFVLFFLSDCNNYKIDSLIHSGIPDNNQQVTTVPFISKDNSIIIKTHINDSHEQYNMLLSTSSMTCVSNILAEKLSLEKQNEIDEYDTSGEVKLTSITLLKKISIGNTNITNCSTYIRNNIKDWYGIETDGILGSNFLRFYKVTIDYQNKTVSFSRDKAMIFGEDDIIIRLRLDRRFGWAPKVACKIEDFETDCIVSTMEYGYLCIPESVTKQLKNYKSNNILTSKGSMLYGAFQFDENNILLRIDTLNIGNKNFYQIPAVSYSDKTSLNLGLIGNDFLSKFKVIFDFRNKLLILKPIVKNLNVFNTNYWSYGISLVNKKNKIIVNGIWNNSPADKSGIKPGDEILYINLQKACELSHYQIDNIFSDKNKNTLVLIYLNKEGEKTVKLQRENLLPDNKNN